MQRNGKKLKTLPDGHPRRMADGKNAYRKMNDEQRLAFFRWIVDSEGPGGEAQLCEALEGVSLHVMGDEDLATIAATGEVTP